MSRSTLNAGLGSGEVDKGSVYPTTTVDQQTLIDGLNHDLAGEYQAIIMYTHYSAKLTGPYRRELRALFQAEIPDEQGHAQFLSEKIATLGGEPTTEPRPVFHVDDPREMLEQALAPSDRRFPITENGSIRPKPSGMSASRSVWRTRSPTRRGTWRRSSAFSPDGAKADRPPGAAGPIACESLREKSQFAFSLLNWAFSVPEETKR